LAKTIYHRVHEDTGNLETPSCVSFFAPAFAAGLDTIHRMHRKVVYIIPMGRTNIVIDESLIRKARKLTRLRTKRQIVDRALDLLVRSESRKGILKYYGSGIWQGDLKTSRRNRV
jgi:Arc/MetJ family transcription regulator